VPSTSPAVTAIATALAADPTNAALRSALEAAIAQATPTAAQPQPTTQATPTTHTEANAQLMSVLDMSVGSLGLVEENRIINAMPIGIVRSWKRTMLATDAAFQVPVILVAGLIRITGFGFSVMDGLEGAGKIAGSILSTWALKYTTENNSTTAKIVGQALEDAGITDQSTSAQVEAALNSVKDEVISSQAETISPEGQATPNPDVVVTKEPKSDEPDMATVMVQMNAMMQQMQTLQADNDKLQAENAVLKDAESESIDAPTTTDQDTFS